MVELSRRDVLKSSALMAAAVGLSACDTAPKGGKASGGLTWWDHFNPLQDLHKEVFAQFGKDTGVTVEYTYHQTQKIGQALQLAKQSKQLPDVHSNAGLLLPLPALIKDGWYQPLHMDEAALSRLPQEALVEGVTSFDGKHYTFPLFNFRQYWSANWFNKELVEKAGLDPTNPPKTYDEFRAAARAIKKKGGDGVYGWINNLGAPPRIAEQVHFLAQAAGFEGAGGAVNGGWEFKTGEFAYHTEPYLTVIEFLLSLKKDGVLLPGTGSMDDKVARTRWASGVAGYYFDGPWCPGVVKQDLPDFLDKVGVGPMLVPDSGMPVTAYRGAQQGAFFVSGYSKKAKDASKLLGYLTEPEYFVKLAEHMDQPPLDLTAIDKADVHPSYKQVVDLFQDAVFLQPQPPVKNIEVTKAEAEMKPVTPELGALVGGMFAGDVTDIPKAMKELSDKHQKAREAGVAKAKQAGAQVSLDDYAFPNWKPRADYTKDMYGQ
ncbi:MAG: ABC transporter substrate-binding protein [Micromonosporaceae bacterium]